MSEPFLAEIRIFPLQFVPKGWVQCNGQLLPVAQNRALFLLIGNAYGGDGESNFALPDLRGRVPMQPGEGPGLPKYDVGQKGGSDTVTLIVSEMPAHRHTMNAQGSQANLGSPSNAVLARPFGGGNLYKTPGGAPIVALNNRSIEPQGGGQPHNNLMPYMPLSFCIALEGIVPNPPPEGS